MAGFGKARIVPCRQSRLNTAIFLRVPFQDFRTRHCSQIELLHICPDLFRVAGEVFCRQPENF
jgi:hypothetical protein